MPDDINRVANSMRRLLVRHYPDPDERQDVAVRIMQKVRGTENSLALHKI